MLDGMFSFVLLDESVTPTRIIASRDPIGITTLYQGRVSSKPGVVMFASELKALRVLPDHSFDIDDRAVHDYFSFGHVRKPRSIYRQVSMLDPGHFLTISAQGLSTIRKSQGRQ